jgi:site-specific DNA recombinase
MTDTSTVTAASKLTVAYLRTASSNQIDSRLGLERQLRDCEDYARSLGVRIVRTYADAGVSGLAESRPAFAQLMKDLSKGGIRRVIVADPARLARSRQLERRMSERIRRSGATLSMPCIPNDRPSDSN